MMHSRVKKIKPCPFCGDNSVPKVRRMDTAACKGVIGVFIECRNCHARGPVFDDFHNREAKSPLRDLALDAWNKRVKED